MYRICVLAAVVHFLSPSQQTFALDPLLPGCDTTAVFLGRDSIAIDLYDDVDASESNVESHYLRFEVDGDTVFVIDPSDITFSGSAAQVDSVYLPYLFDRLARHIVIDAVGKGYITSVGLCESPNQVDLLAPTCVLRVGIGTMTVLVSVDECVQAIRTVEHCQFGNAVSAGIAGIVGCGECSTGESTCSGSGGPGLE